MPADDDFYYEGFSSPNGTIVPDDVFDVLAPRLKESELRVLLYIVRRTFGFGKQADAISLSQMTDGITTRDGRVIDRGTGMSKKAVIQGVKGLATKGIIEVDRRKKQRGHNAVNIYRLRFRSQEGIVTESNPPSDLRSPPVVTTSNPQETESQETESHNNRHVVVDEKNPVRQNPLYDKLKDAGIHHNTAAKLIQEHEDERISNILKHVRKRIASGWMPDESAAAWIVAAIRNDYELPEQQTTAWVMGISADEAAKLSERQQKELEREFADARRQKAAELTGSAETDQIWLNLQEEMKEQGTWVPVLASSFLKIQDGTATILVPAVVAEHADGVQKIVRQALQSSELIRQEVKEVELARYRR